MIKKYTYAGRPKKPAVIQVKVSKHLIEVMQSLMLDNETYRAVLDSLIENEINERKGILK